MNPELIPPLLAAVHTLQPHVTVVSGDFTQRAAREEFCHARDFVQQLPEPRILVPGNHDMSFFNPYRRVTQRLRFYEEYITRDLAPFYRDDEIAVLGLNTARVSRVRGGRIRLPQIDLLETRFQDLPPDAMRILVTHHPFDLPDSYNPRHIVSGADEVIERVVRCVDVLLAGHMHRTHSGSTAERYRVGGSSALFVQAGTALSMRSRGEANSFNALRIHRDLVEVIQYTFEGKTFGPQAVHRFRREH